MVVLEDIDFKKSYMVRKKAMNVLKEKHKKTIDFIDYTIDKAAEKGFFCVTVGISIKENEEETLNSLIKLYKECGGFRITITERIKDMDNVIKYFITFYW